jgi:diguanylate cyclase (GGDEF)-like protein
VFRYGGDEFLLLLPGTTAEESWQLVERIRNGLARTQLGRAGSGQPIYLTASFGLTPVATDFEAEECIARADKALLLAKAAGRNRTVCWDPATSTGTILERELSARPASRD